jgi:phosphatidylglycerol---prolipoprotein diacylglyceryl transferase
VDALLSPDGLLGAITWPVLDRIRIGGLSLSPHGLGIAAGYLLGSWWVLREGPKRGVREEHITSMLFWALVGTIVGARLFYVIGHYDEFESIGEMLAIWEGGISLLGGMAGGVLFALPLMRSYGYRFFQVMDTTAIGFPFGIFVGRIGDLIIGDHLGKPTSVPWAFSYSGGELAGYQCVPDGCVANLLGGEAGIVSITEQEARLVLPDGDVVTGAGVHQTALYDFVSVFFLFLFMYLVMGSRPRREGVMILTFALWYGSVRIVTDFLRVDKRYFGLTGSQWTSVAAVSLAVLILSWWAVRKGPGPEAREPIVEVEPAAAPSHAFTPPPEPSADMKWSSP